MQCSYWFALKCRTTRKGFNDRCIELNFLSRQTPTPLHPHVRFCPDTYLEFSLPPWTQIRNRIRQNLNLMTFWRWRKMIWRQMGFVYILKLVIPHRTMLPDTFVTGHLVRKINYPFTLTYFYICQFIDHSDRLRY